MRITLYAIAAALLVVVLPCQAQDIVEGTVLAFDRKAKVIVFTDKSVWSLEKLETAVPEQLKAGDRVEIKYQANEDEGVTLVHDVRIIPE